MTVRVERMSRATFPGACALHLDSSRAEGAILSEDDAFRRMHEFEARLYDPDAIVLVALRDDAVIGYVGVCAGAYLKGRHAVAVSLVGFYVIESERGGQVAWLLLRRAIATIHHYKAEIVQACVLAGNERMQRIMRRFGFVPHAIIFERAEHGQADVRTEASRQVRQEGCWNARRCRDGHAREPSVPVGPGSCDGLGQER